jgi:hypothetical protein
MGNSPEVPATGLDPVTARGRVQTVLRPITLGAAGALLSAAAYAGFTILDKTQEYETSALLGAAVAVAVAVGSAAAGLGSLWTRVISLALTSLSLLLSEYVIDRHFVGLALPFRDMVTVIHDRLFADKWTFVSWGISLFFAWHAPNIASRLIEADSPSHEATGAGHRLRLWILGRGIWVTAAAAAAVGLAVLITLGRAGLDSPRVTVVDKTVPIARDQAGHVTRASAVPVQQVRAGDCYNEPPGRSLELLPVVPCQQSHDAEVYYTFDMAAETYPGDGAAATSADEACGRAFPTVAGPLDRYLGYNYFVPDRQTWDTGAHTVVCTMGRTDNKKLDGPVPTH